jgi:hypothetical protein
MFLDLLKEETGCPYHMVVGFTTTYAISDLWYGGGFLRVLWFPPPIKLTATT